MEFRYIVIDEFGDSVRAFHDKADAKRFISIRPECRIEEIPHEAITKNDIDLDAFTKEHGEPPF